MDNNLAPVTQEISVDRRQNLDLIRHIDASRSGNVDTVLSVLRKCETITLTVEQMDLGADIVNSISKHPGTALTAWYLIRYGMLLERGGLEVS